MFQNIQNLNPNLKNISVKQKKTSSRSSSLEKTNSSSSFGQIFSQKIQSTTEIESFLEDISEEIGELENQGKLLTSSPSLKNFYQYRRTLTKILKQLIPNTFEINKNYSLNSKTMTQKEYHLVKSINEEMSSLLKMIETNQKENLTIASRVISIKGLIIDFYS